jgi:hypothetical protein
MDKRVLYIKQFDGNIKLIITDDFDDHSNDFLDAGEELIGDRLVNEIVVLNTSCKVSDLIDDSYH